jgi:hypothetical protein
VPWFPEFARKMPKQHGGHALKLKIDFLGENQRVNSEDIFA